MESSRIYSAKQYAENRKIYINKFMYLLILERKKQSKKTEKESRRSFVFYNMFFL